MSTYRASLVIEVNSVQTANVMFFEDTTIGSNPDREEELKEYLTNAGFAGSWADDWAALFSEEAAITCARIQQVLPTEETARVFFVNTPGEVVGDCSPSQLAFIMRLYSAVATKRGRGRHFFAGIPEANIDGGNYAQSVWATYEQFAGKFVPGSGSPDGSVWRSSVYSGTDDTYRDAVQAIPDPIPRNQRPRTGRLCGT